MSVNEVLQALHLELSVLEQVNELGKNLGVSPFDAFDPLGNEEFKNLKFLLCELGLVSTKLIRMKGYQKLDTLAYEPCSGKHGVGIVLHCPNANCAFAPFSKSYHSAIVITKA